MNPLLFTLTFLTLMAILTSSELLQHTHEVTTHHLIATAQQQQQQSQGLTEQALFDDLQNEKVATRTPSAPRLPSSLLTQKRKAPALRYQISRPPNNSRLNFALIIQEEDPFWTEAAASLMRILYQEYPFFQKVPHAEYRILEALIAHKEALENCDSPETLATLDLGSLQPLFYTLLKGEEAPSLLDYITYDPLLTRTQRKLNLLFASSPLLHAVIGDSEICYRLHALIETRWQEIETESELTRTLIRQRLTQEVEELLRTTSLPKEELKKRFDFTLGKPGSLLFLQNPVTGRTERIPVPNRHETKSR